MWSTGIGAVILFYLAVLFGSRLYFHRVDFVGTSSLVLVFLAQAKGSRAFSPAVVG